MKSTLNQEEKPATDIHGSAGTVGLPVGEENRNNSGAIDAEGDINTTEYVGSSHNIGGIPQNEN